MRLVVERAAGSASAVHDPSGSRPGRGAYLCEGGQPGRPASACVERALKRGAIARTLRATVAIDPKLVESVSP